MIALTLTRMHLVFLRETGDLPAGLRHPLDGPQAIIVCNHLAQTNRKGHLSIMNMTVVKAQLNPRWILAAKAIHQCNPKV